MTAVVTWAVIALLVGAMLGAAVLLVVAEFHAERTARLRRLWRDRG